MITLLLGCGRPDKSLEQAECFDVSADVTTRASAARLIAFQYDAPPDRHKPQQNVQPHFPHPIIALAGVRLTHVERELYYESAAASKFHPPGQTCQGPPGGRLYWHAGGARWCRTRTEPESVDSCGFPQATGFSRLVPLNAQLRMQTGPQNHDPSPGFEGHAWARADFGWTLTATDEDLQRELIAKMHSPPMSFRGESVQLWLEPDSVVLAVAMEVSAAYGKAWAAAWAEAHPPAP